MYCSRCGANLTRENVKLDTSFGIGQKVDLIKICVKCGATIEKVGVIDRA